MGPSWVDALHEQQREGMAFLLQDTSSSNSTAQSSETAASHPFLTFDGFIDGSWWVFLLVAVGSSRLATVTPKVGLPLITGYMIVGCLCGPYVLNIVTNSMIPELSYVTQTALAFIAYSAGSELYLPELRSLFRSICYVTAFISVITYVVCMFGIWGLSNVGLMTWTNGFLQECKFGIALLASSIMTARSPASAIAVVKELRAKGPVTSTMLGVTVMGDLVVLVLFSLSASFTQSFCAGGGFDSWGLIITIISLIAAVGFGYLLGAVLMFLLWVRRVPAYFTILPLGFLFFIFSDWFAAWSTQNWQFTISLDALLICITAGYVVTNKSKNRTKFLQMLSGAGPYVFIPFFTLVGVQLNLNVLAHSIAFAFSVWAMRAASIFAGCFLAGHFLKWDLFKKTTVWLTMLAQAGVSLGLAAEASVRFPAFGSSFQAAIIGVVLINQLLGPVACKWALKKHQEDGKLSAMDEGEHEEAGDDGTTGEKRPRRKHVLIVGVDNVALGYAQRLLNEDYAVVFADSSQAALDLCHSLILPKKEVRLDLVEEVGKRTVQVLMKTVDVTTQVVKGTVNVAAAVGSAVGSGVMQGVKMIQRSMGSPAHSAAAQSQNMELEHSQTELSAQQSEEEKDTEPASDEAKVELITSSSSASSSESFPESTSEQSLARVSSTDEKLVYLQLLSPSASASYLDELDKALSDLKMNGEKFFSAALVSLRKDFQTQEVALFLVEKKRMSKVLARCKNPAWAQLFAAQGIVPFFSLSSNLTLMKTVTTADDHLQVTVPGKNSMPETMNQCVEAIEDYTHYLLSLPEEQRQKYEEDHQPPTASQMAALEESYRALVSDEVKLGEVVAEAHREHYMDTLASLGHDADHGVRNEDFQSEMDLSEEAFTSPALLKHQEAEKKKRESSARAAAASSASRSSNAPSVAVRTSAAVISPSSPSASSASSSSSASSAARPAGILTPKSPAIR